MRTILSFRPKAVAICTILLLTSWSFNGCRKDDTAPKKTYSISAQLNGANEVPPNASKGVGVLSGSYNSASRVLSYRLVWTLLTGGAQAAHFHGPALPGENAGIRVGLIGFPAGGDGLVSGRATLTEEQEAELLSGRWYVNVHTFKYPGGEIRGQVRLLPW
jgi:hypothetical protein